MVGFAGPVVSVPSAFKVLVLNELKNNRRFADSVTNRMNVIIVDKVGDW